jgi:hypothetical protein
MKLKEVLGRIKFSKKVVAAMVAQIQGSQM